MSQLHQMLRAVADPIRLRILNLLREGDICVCDLQAVLRIPQPTVSRHLTTLRNAGLVVDTRAGTRVIYALAGADPPRIRALWRFLSEAFTQEETMQKDLLALREAVHEGECRLMRRSVDVGSTASQGGRP